jgi:hypothetical protein
MDSISGNELLKESLVWIGKYPVNSCGKQNDDDLKKAIEWVFWCEKGLSPRYEKQFSSCFLYGSRFGEIKKNVRFHISPTGMLISRRNCGSR